MYGDAVVLAPVVDRHDVRVVQRRRRLRLGAEAAEEAVVVGEAGVQDLHRHPAAQPDVVGEEDTRRRAGADQRQQPVPPAQDATDEVGEGGVGHVEDQATSRPLRIGGTVPASGSSLSHYPPAMPSGTLEALVASDRQFFEAGATNERIGPATMSSMRGLTHLAAGCVLHTVDARQITSPAAWLHEVELHVRTCGGSLVRIYLSSAICRWRPSSRSAATRSARSSPTPPRDRCRRRSRASRSVSSRPRMTPSGPWRLDSTAPRGSVRRSTTPIPTSGLR